MHEVSLLLASRALELGEHGEADPFHHTTSLRSLFQEVAVTPLADEDGADILQRGFRSTGSEDYDAAVSLAKQCGGVPLLLNLAASVLSTGKAGFEVRVTLCPS